VTGSVREALKGSDAVFSGRVVLIETTSSEFRHPFDANGPVVGVVNQRRLVFVVTASWKGSQDTVLTVLTRSGQGDCGLAGLAIDQEWLIFAWKAHGDLWTGSCSRSSLLPTAGAVVDSLPRPRSKP